MIWFKLSSGEGENKVLMTNVSGIEDVKRKGAEKLKLGEDLDDLHLYLNDGTEICSDEDFIPELIVGNLLFLRKSTSTSPASLPPKQIRFDGSPDRKKLKTDTGGGADGFLGEPNFDRTPDIKRKIPKGDISDSSEYSPSSDVGLAEPLELPTFTIPVKVALRDGDCSGGIWNVMLDELQQFYVANYPDRLHKSRDYKLVGEMMYARYPCIKRDGKKPWSYLTHLLSGRMRTLRHNKKFKNLTCARFKSEDSGSSTLSSSPSVCESSDEEPKRFSSITNLEKRFGFKDEKEDGGELVTNLSDEDYSSCIKECKKMMDKKQIKRADIKMMLKRTFPNRRQDIRKMDREGHPMMSTVIVDWPCFEFGEFIIEEMKLVLHKKDKELDLMKARTKKVLSAWDSMVPRKHVTKKGEDRIPELLDYIAREVSFRKKNSNIPLYTHYDASPDKVDDITNTLPNTSPVLHLFFTKNGVFQQGIISGDTERIDSQANDVMLCILTYISCFFVFHIGFPGEIGQFLAFLQQSLLQVAYEGKKSNGFKEVISKFDGEMIKISSSAQFKKLCVG